LTLDFHVEVRNVGSELVQLVLHVRSEVSLCFLKIFFINHIQRHVELLQSIHDFFFEIPELGHFF
jgi:hypothetical protein